MSNRKWHGRVFTSLCSLVSFILIVLTTIILYIEPHGRVAYWTHWDFFGPGERPVGQHPHFLRSRVPTWPAVSTFITTGNLIYVYWSSIEGFKH